MKNLFIAMLAITIFSCTSSKKETYNYPSIASQEITETYHGIDVIDPYRNIENLKDTVVLNWLKDEEAFSKSIVNRISNKDDFFEEVMAIENKKEDLIDSYRIYKDDSYVYLKRDKEESISKLYYKDKIDGKEKLLIDPVVLGDGKYISIYRRSPDLSKIAICYTPLGEDKSEIVVYDINTNTIIENVKITDVGLESRGIYWLPDSSGFLYQSLPHFRYNDVSYLLDSKSMLYLLDGSTKKSLEVFSKKVTRDLDITSADFPVLQTRQNNPNLLFGVIDGDATFKDVYYTNINDFISNRKIDVWKPLFKKEDEVDYYRISNDSIIYRTAKNAPNYRVCKTSLTDPNFENPIELIAEQENSIISDFVTSGNKIYYTTLYNGVEAHFYVSENGVSKEIILPYPSGSSYVSKDHRGIRVSLSGWTKEALQYRYDEIDNSFTKISPDNTDYSEYENIIVEEIEIPSYDGTLVPLSIIFKPGLIKDGTNRTLIYGYGSYGATYSPTFFASFLNWVNKGGIVAVAHIRGGGAKGDIWHKGGYKTTKHNTWKDVIACTEYLIDNKYTSPEKTVGYGVSAGGVAIGRAITERPDLYKVALLGVPFLNTVRSEFMPYGANSVKEFGTIKDSLEFKALLGMDSYHHIEEDKKYPAIYVTAGINDGAVTPWDPAKFVARMQNMSSTDNPILFSVNFGGGHGGNGTINDFYKTNGEMMTFALWQTGHPDYQLKE